MSRTRKNPSGVDPHLLIKDAAKLMPHPTRRALLRRGASLGALALLTGCDIVDGASAERALMQVSYFNDRIQAWLFNPSKLAPTYPDTAVTRPFPFNAYYPEEDPTPPPVPTHLPEWAADVRFRLETVGATSLALFERVLDLWVDPAWLLIPLRTVSVPAADALFPDAFVQLAAEPV